MNYDYEVDAYHPRYARSEYLELMAEDRRRKRRDLAFVLFGLVCLAGLLYVVSHP